MRSLTSLPDSASGEHHSGKPNVFLNLFCPDCGTKCEHIGTNPFENQWCFTCSSSFHKRNVHWTRWYKGVEYVRIDECEICHDAEELAGLEVFNEVEG